MREGCGLFAITPIEVALDKRLTLRQMRVLIALLSFNGDGSNVVWPKRETLAQRCGMSAVTVSTVTSELERLGWLRKEGNGGRSKATHYIITIPETVTCAVTVIERQTVTQHATVSGRETVTADVNKTVTADAETVTADAETVTADVNKTVTADVTGIEKKEKRKEEKKGGTRAREARAAPPPPQNGGVQESGGAVGAGASTAQGTPPAPVAAQSTPAPHAPPAEAPPPLSPAAQRAALAAALAADAAKRHPLCPPEVPAEVFNDWLALRREKHAPVNATVIRIAREEADRAGMSLSRFLEQWCLAGSARFSADWLIADRQRAGEKKGVEPMRDENGEVLFFEDIMRRRAQRRAEEARRKQQEKRNAL